jgi:RNA polymerase sigma-70 factor (ECF subfamily)
MVAMTPSEPLTDASLAAAWRAGDEGAAAEIVRRHAGAVARFLYSAGAGRSDLDDLVQETLFRGFRRLDSWRGEASLRSWLCCIAGNVLKDQYRRSKGRTVVTIDEAEVVDHANPHDEATASEAEARLRAGRGTLPRLQREVFLMRAQQGCEYGEIATALGTTPGAARVHYHHAVKRLKELMS